MWLQFLAVHQSQERELVISMHRVGASCERLDFWLFLREPEARATPQCVFSVEIWPLWPPLDRLVLSISCHLLKVSNKWYNKSVLSLLVVKCVSLGWIQGSVLSILIFWVACGRSTEPKEHHHFEFKNKTNYFSIGGQPRFESLRTDHSSDIREEEKLVEKWNWVKFLMPMVGWI